MHAPVRLEHALVAVESEHDVHVMLELAAPEPPEAAERAPLRLALVLDRSGSMAGEKLAVARRCAAWLVGRLRPGDELALVDFDDEARLLAPLAPVERRRLEQALARIEAGGSTDLSDGWLKGLEELRRAGGDGPRKILLFTDGLANVGITDPTRLAALAAGAYGDGVGTSTIGFGDGFDEDLSTALADAGGGRAHYAATPDAAPAIFAEELGGLTRLVAQNVSVEIRPSADVELLAVLNDYPAVAVEGGLQLALGDAYGGERRRVVLALHLPLLAGLGAVKVADLVVRYVSVGEDIAGHTLTVPVAVNLVSADEAAAAVADLEVREEVLVLQAARARREAIRLADGGDHTAAARVLGETESALRQAVEDLPGRAALLVAEADELAEAAEAVRRYGPAERKLLRYEASFRQRRPRP